MIFEKVNSLEPKKFIHDVMLPAFHSMELAESVEKLRPFPDDKVIYKTIKVNFQNLSVAKRIKSFNGHPKIGEKINPETKSASLSVVEQKDIQHEQFKSLNEEYLKKFGFLFLIKASGKTSEEIIEALKSRLTNNRNQEIKVATNELVQIGLSRLESLV